MLDINPDDIYIAYGNEDIWCDGNVKQSFISLYESGYRYITHYDTKYTALYSIYANGEYYCIYGSDYFEIIGEPDEESGGQSTLNNVQEILAALYDPKYRVYWKPSPTQSYEISINDPIYTLLYTSIPSQTMVYKFYKEHV